MASENAFGQTAEAVDNDFFELPATVNLLESSGTFTDVPNVGALVENCRLVAELGSGSSGRVFLAKQPTLADRAIVLKITSRTHDEHLNLARLQHTHIMPLYWATIQPQNGLRILAMPFLGNTTLARLLERLRIAPIDTWNGEHVFAALQKEQAALPVQIQPHEHAAQVLRQSSWVDFVLRTCQVLAEALAFAHQRDLLHLDIKPSNILITPDGQPILLDLDVARQPVAAGTPGVAWFGGTPGFMSPEQWQAMEALAHHETIPTGVDERSDVYSLGMVLYEAMGGTFVADRRQHPRNLIAINPGVTPEIADIIAHCIAEKPEDRYPNCTALAADLDRQLQNLPLAGVREHWINRWHKWRRRRPFALPMVMLGLCFCAMASIAGYGLQQAHSERRDQAEAALMEGEELQRLGQHEAAARRFSAGRENAAHAFGATALHEQLSRRSRNAERMQVAQELYQTVKLMRYYALEEQMPLRKQHVLEAAGRRVWAKRLLLTDRTAGTLEAAVEQRINSELQELMLLWPHLQMRLAPATHKAGVRAEVQKAIGQAEQLFGSSFAVALARQQHGPGNPQANVKAILPWEHCALGRIAFREGDFMKADVHFQRAFDADPLNPVCNLHVGVLAHRQKKYADAIQAFSYCLGADPASECFVLRGAAYAGLAKTDRALSDFQQAITRNPESARAFQLRGNLHQSMGRTEEAQADWQRAKEVGD